MLWVMARGELIYATLEINKDRFKQKNLEEIVYNVQIFRHHSQLYSVAPRSTSESHLRRLDDRPTNLNPFGKPLRVVNRNRLWPHLAY